MRITVSDSEILQVFRIGKSLRRYDTAFRFGKGQAAPNNFRFGRVGFSESETPGAAARRFSDSERLGPFSESEIFLQSQPHNWPGVICV